MASVRIENEEHWKSLRAKHVGGSEIAALFDACSYLTRLELWLAKRGELSGEMSDNARTFWGRYLEDAIAQGVAATKGWAVENPKAYFTCDDTPGMGCTPDRVIAHASHRDTPGLLQIKNTDWLVFKKWEDGEPPLQYHLQLQHELACTGHAWGALAVLIGGNDLKVFEYDAHDGVQAKLKRAVTQFWASVESGAMPKATGDDYDVVRELYQDSFGEIIDLTGDNEMPVLCAAALDAGSRRLAAEKEEKAAKAGIMQKVGEASYARCDGFGIKRTQVNRAEHIVKASSYIKLTVKEGNLA